MSDREPEWDGGPRKLVRLDIRPSGAGLVLRVETEGGGCFEVTASYEQLDEIADHLDDILQDGPGGA